MTDYFWKKYSQELDSWRDQPLFSYCVHHNKFTPIDYPSTNISKHPLKWALEGISTQKRTTSNWVCVPVTK